jgi:hypothetical protein
VESIEQKYDKIYCRKEDSPSKSREAQEEEEFFDLVGKEHVDRRPTPEDVRSIVERIRAKSKVR